MQKAPRLGVSACPFSDPAARERTRAVTLGIGRWELGVESNKALRYTPPLPMANIYDVAKEARVSLATVSAVVNESAYVSPGLKMRVTAAIQKLAYQPNLVAR